MKKRVLIMLLVAVLTFGLAFAFTACENEKLIGFDTELSAAVAKDLGLKVKYQEIDWNQNLSELNAKNIDAVWNGMSMSDDRLDKYTFSNTYMMNSQVVVIRKADVEKYKTLEDVAAAKVVVENNSTASKVTIKNEETPNVIYNPLFDESNVLAATTQILALTEILSGTSDAAMVDSVMAYSSLKQNPNFDSALTVADIEVGVEVPYAIGLRKISKNGAENFGLKAKIDASLKKMWDNGTIAALGEKYGLTGELINCGGDTPVSNYDSLSADQKADWQSIEKKGRLIVGYTLFAPIAYFE
jgi:polar amino acid transport system substrate-binding protein